MRTLGRKILGAPWLGLMSLSLLIGDASWSAPPNDPFFSSSGSWGQDYADQWALQRIGYSESTSGAPVIVAIIDTGLDYTHPDFSPDNLWFNVQERLNGIDDDENGYVDDVAGWNFVEKNKNPWDRVGHGTHIAGIIASASNNDSGIAGLNPNARIMPLKTLNFLGRGRSDQIAAAIHYAIDNGARVINLSLGSTQVSQVERSAVQRAVDASIVVVVAAGNTSRDTHEFGMADLPGVLTVAASDPADQRAEFSNWGQAVNITAPGVDILSLRARGSDFIYLSTGDPAKRATAFVGPDIQYYRASGTSFAAGFVTGLASLMISTNANLSGEQVTRMILNSATDIGAVGMDSATGYGLINVSAALAADPKFFLTADIQQAEVESGLAGKQLIITGSVDADEFDVASIELATMDYPTDWIRVTEVLEAPVRNGILARIDGKYLRGADDWIVRVRAQHANGMIRETRMAVAD